MICSSQLRLVRTVLFSSTVLSPLVATPAAIAQVAETPRQEPITLPAVNVESKAESASGPVLGYVARLSTTGTKTDTPLIETPQSVSVVGRQQVIDTGAQSVGQALAYTAGVQTQPFGFDPRYDQFVIRGFASNQFGNYRDGLRQANGSFAYFRNEPSELERIEVLRGPSSVLYGSNNPGGLVNVVSKMPTMTTFKDVQVTLGNYNRYQGQFDVGGVVDENARVGFRITGFARDSDTQVPNTKDNRIAIAPSVTVKLGDNTTLTLLTEYQKNQTSMWPYFLNLPGKGVVNIRVGDPEYDALREQQWSIGYKLEHRVNDTLTLRQNLRYSRVYFDGQFVDAASLSANGQTLNRYSGMFQERLEGLNVDNQAQLRFATGPVSHTVLAGVDYFHQGFDQNFGLGTAPPLSLVNPIYSTRIVPTIVPSSRTYQTLDQVGLYAQEQLAWQKWRLTLGGRQDFATTYSRNLVTGTTASNDPSAFTGRVGLLYLLDSGITPYASYSTSFLPISGTTAPARGTKPFDPTNGEQWEAGIKYQPPGMNSSVTATAFHLTQSNVLTTDPLARTFSIQTGEVRSEGFELEAVADLGRGLKGIASYSYTDVVNTSSNTAQGKVPVGVPKHQAAVFLDYTAPEGPVKGFGVAGGVRYIGATWADAANTQRNGEIPAFDVAVHQDINKFRLALNVNNIADRRVPICNSGNCTFSLGRIILGSVRVLW